MPSRAAINPDIHYSVDRPVILNVVRDLMNVTGMSPRTVINFFGLEGKAYQTSTTLEENKLGSDFNRWEFDERLFIDVEEEYSPDEVWFAMGRREHAPIFSDDALGVYIRPVYAMSKIKINFKYRARDNNEAVMWRNAMRLRANSMRTVLLHQIAYNYHINDELLEIIMEIWSKREAQAGYGQEAAEYFATHLTSRAHIVSSFDGKHKLWAITDHARSQGWFEYELAPDKAEREGAHDNYTTSFTYVFEYQKPLACLIDYPLVIHNQLIDEKYFPETPMKDETDVQSYYSVSGLAYASFSSTQRNLQVNSFEGVNIPEFDDWHPKLVRPTTVKIVTVLCAVDKDNPRFLFNLNDLGDWKIHPDILDWLRAGEYAFVNGLYTSIVQLNLYEGGDLQPVDQITLDENLNVYATRDLDLRLTYHVRLSLVTDINYLNLETVRRCQQSPIVMMRFVNAINASIAGFNGGRQDIGKNMLSAGDVAQLTLKQVDPFYNRAMRPHFVKEIFHQVNGDIVV